MNQPPPYAPPVYSPQDDEHLNLLAIFHFVLAGLIGFGLAFLFFHYLAFSTIFNEEMWAEVAAEAAAAAEAAEASASASSSGSPTTPSSPAGPSSSAPSASPAPPTFNGPPPQLAMFMRGFYMLSAIFMVSLLVINVMAGLFLKKRKNRTFLLVVSGINCINFPIGTTLGVFTLVLLLKPHIAGRFAR